MKRKQREKLERIASLKRQYKQIIREMDLPFLEEERGICASYTMDQEELQICIDYLGG